jgi:hypothetical protein
MLNKQAIAKCASAGGISTTHGQSIVESVMTMVLASPKYAFAGGCGKNRGMYCNVIGGLLTPESTTKWG